MTSEDKDKDYVMVSNVDSMKQDGEGEFAIVPKNSPRDEAPASTAEKSK